MNTARPLVSYDDLSSTAAVPSTEKPDTKTAPKKHAPSPSKRRKRAHRRPPAHRQDAVVHWDEPDEQGERMDYGDDENGANGLEGWEESRELTHEEIWDDSALIEAWNAATEEYEAYHGPSKGWKKEPVHKSPLWWNVPPQESRPESPEKNSKKSQMPLSNGSEADSRPLKFDTFVPTHDPSLKISSDTQPSVPNPADAAYHPDARGAFVPQDEAFSRAMDAMYWGGYWTAVYHFQRHLTQEQSIEHQEEEGDEGEEEEDEGDDDEMISTQR